MSTDVTIHPSSAVAEKIEWARAMAPAGLLPKAYQGKPANLLLAAELADSLGIARVNALTSIHVIEGKPTASADLMAALVRRAGHKLRVQMKPDAARATLIRADDPDFEFEATWTLARAQAAGLAGKGVWKAHPQAMLRSRAITEVIRAGASEVLVGVIYTPEELNVEVDASGQPTQPTYVTEASPVTAAEIIGDPDHDVQEAEVVEDPPAWDEGGDTLPIGEH